jgi:hypothetical protein
MSEDIDYASIRRQLYEAVDESVSVDESVVLSGIIVIYEGLQPDGTRIFSMITSNATGDEPIVPWVGKGMLNYASDNYEYMEFFEEEEQEE